MKKIVTLLLAIIMIVSVFAGCKNEPAGEGSETKAPSASKPNGNDSKPAESESTGGEEDPKVNIYEELGLQDGLNYNDVEVNIVHWTPVKAEFGVTVDQLDGDPIADAVYKRNLYTEELLGVKLEWIHNEYTGNSESQMNEWCQKLEEMMNDPSTPIDFFASYSRVLSVATIRGTNQDITVYENIDFEKEWWPQNLVADYSIRDKIFTITGDISTSMLLNMYAIFFNKTMAEKFGVGDLVQIVNDKEWTIDKFITSCQNVFQDLDESSDKSAGDQVAIALDYWHIDPLIQGAGFKILEASDKDGEYMVITEDFFSEKFGNFLGKLTEWGKTDDVIIDDTYSGISGSMFVESRALFDINAMSYGFTLQNTDIDYALLPPPMLDPEAQGEKYVTTLANTYSLYSMTRNCTDGERAAAIMNTLGYYGKELCTPAVYDVTFKGKFSKDDAMMDMLDLLRSSIGFDMGLLYMRALNSINDKPCMAVCKGQDWAVAMGAIQQTALKKLEVRLNKSLDDAMNA